ncbi:MAG: TetR/AcrR family transcriptional regulator [Flammeovirgaceae bacterium]
MSSTKEKILKEAVRLFNEKGYAHVSLRDIAKAIGISQGNLTYHYKTKVMLMMAIYERMLEESQTYIMPGGFLTLHHFEQMLNKFYVYQHKYRFFFIDIVHISRTYPDLGLMYEKSVYQRMADGRKLIDYYVETGRMKPEDEFIDYGRLGHSIWMVSAFWLSQREIIPDAAVQEASPIQHLWHLVMPVLTEKGLEEYREIVKFRNTEIKELQVDKEA